MSSRFTFFWKRLSPRKWGSFHLDSPFEKAIYRSLFLPDSSPEDTPFSENHKTPSPHRFTRSQAELPWLEDIAS